MAYTIHRKLMVGKYGPCWSERNSRPSHIVLHHTASGWNGREKTGGCAAVWSYWYGLKPRNRVSSTDILGKNGYIMRCVSPLDSAWHAGSSEWNNKSIGIEIVNRGDNKDPFPEEQLRALAWLVHRYMKAYGIPRRNVTDHKAVCAGKIDMRDNFPWERLWRYVKALEKTPAPPPAITVPVEPKRPSWWAQRGFRINKRRR